MTINNHKLPDRISVLGTEYRIRYTTEDKDPRMEGADGYCDPSVHEIRIEKSLFLPPKDGKTLRDLGSYGLKVLRHEIIHAFISESGLDECCEWARNEELVDWIARQFPKIQDCFRKAGCER